MRDDGHIGRRAFVVAGGATLAALATHLPQSLPAQTRMYGLIGRLKATPGQRDALVTILLEGTEAMPGCLSYVVAADPTDADAIWVTEVWDSQASHDASLQLPAVRTAIMKGRPLIATGDFSAVTTPLGGVGLPAPR